MNTNLERVVSLAERLGACAALAAGGSLITSFANRLAFGPLVPRIVGILAVAVASALASLVCIDFVNSLPVRNKIALVGGALFCSLLSLTAFYLVNAAVYAAQVSAAH